MATRRKKTSSRKTVASRKPSPADPGDFVAVAKQYARAAIADKKGKRFGRLIRLAAQRFIDDLKRSKTKGNPFIFDEWHAVDACDFIQKLPHVEGVWKNQDGSPQPNIVLHPSHVFFVVQLFGFRKLDGTRRFTSALFAVARKNAKSTLASAILLYCQCCEEEPGAQIISAATTGSQARIIFNVAKRMTEKKKTLREAFGLECWANAITRFDTGSSFKPINAKASTQDGLNPSHVGLDEIHAHKTPDLLNVLTSAAGARACPLWLYTTTEGYSNPGPWSEIRLFATQLLEGIFGHKADHFLAIFFAVDATDSDFDEGAWHKANPLADTNPHLIAAIRKEAVEAGAMPSKLAEFQIKRLNRPASAANGFILLPKWMLCNGEVDLDALREVPCWGGLDLSSTTDLTAWRLVWKVDDVILTWGRRWVPAGAVARRTERGTVPYAGWVASGLMEETQGDVVDYTVIEAAVLADVARFNMQKIGFDKWNATDLVSRLQTQLPEDMLLEFVQGPKSYHPAMTTLERAYISGKLAHGGDPVLAWNAANLIARKDQNLNLAPDKRRSPEKIDDMAALLMAIGVSGAPVESDQIEQGFVVL